MIIGVTGRIASGKTAVSDVFESNGFFRIDADRVFYDLKETSDDMNNEIILRFNSLDNNIILDHIKNDKSALSDLNEITHKFVVKKIEDIIIENSNMNIILDVPVPVKRGFLDIVDYIIVTNCNQNTQIKRLMKRSNEDAHGAKIKIDMQRDETFYRGLGDMIIETDDLNLEELAKIIKKEFNL